MFKGLITKVKSSKAFKKTISVIAAASLAVSAMAVNVFANGGTPSSGGGSVDISSVTDSLQSNLIDLATKAGIACAAVVGAGLTIFGIKWVVKKIMGFFKVIGN